MTEGYFADFGPLGEFEAVHGPLSIDVLESERANRAPIIHEPIIFSVTTIDGSMPISGLVGTMTATDEDDDALTFSITGGEDAELFSIDPLTGAIRLTTVIEPAAPPLDGDGDMRYFIEVTVSDNQAMDTETVQFHLDPGSVQNHAPFLLEPVIFFAPSSDFGTDTFAAVLNGQDPEGDAITYSIAGGEDGALFTVDPVTGELSFTEAAFFHTPRDANADNQYLVDITVADDFGSTTQTVQIHVTEVLCSGCRPAPTIIGPVTTTPFEPVQQFLSQSAEAALSQIEISSPGGAVQFSLFGEDADRFEIDTATGLISMRADAGLTQIGSFDGDAIYEVVVLIEDQFGGSDTLAMDYLLLQGG